MKENPRSAAGYVEEVVKLLGFADATKHPELSPAEFELAADQVRRKAGAFWVEKSPRRREP